ncbi:hypothetical protein L1987_55026 [Smallanthus sonchifolius]|uniref:Uncharacterized protein n=1 Tax=Smallanthus sonchifolius TaxID=185202 RepID=A0ACB9E956_9ASTR|nr:hypothetical protein L1987_55026 [Smallanthus sonchifolius]
MGKSEPQLPLNHRRHHQQQPQNRHQSSFFVQCSTGFSRIARLFSFKCVFVLLLSVAVSLSAIFSLLHLHHGRSGFDAKDSVKHGATVQAYFRLEKPVSFLIPQITRLEYDINDEIGVPGTQVAVLSMHESGSSNWTDVVFGVLSKPMNSPINSVSLSVLRSSLVELFTQSSNLTLTKSIFGTPSSFEILKFLGGITIIPKLSIPVWMLPQVLFNFTLYNSLREIEENFLELEEQLKSGLHLMPYESVFVQVTNKGGSTKHPPVTVQASVMSALGGLDPQRLKELAQEIRGSPPAKNLGLDHAVFGKVKEISLSSYLYHSLDAPTPILSPAPAPAPSPDQMGPTISPSPDVRPYRSLPPSSPPAMDPSCGGSPGPSHHALPPLAPPNLPPLPAVSYGSSPHQKKGLQKGLAPSPHSVLPSSSSEHGDLWRILCPVLFILITLHIL